MHNWMLGHNPYESENGKKWRLEPFGTAQSIYEGRSRSSEPNLFRQESTRLFCNIFTAFVTQVTITEFFE